MKLNLLKVSVFHIMHDWNWASQKPGVILYQYTQNQIPLPNVSAFHQIQNFVKMYPVASDMKETAFLSL
jgi:hypothetical protein